MRALTVALLCTPQMFRIHDLARAEGGDQNPFSEGLEDQPIDGIPDRQAFADLGRCQYGQPGDGLPLPPRDRAKGPLPA